MAKKKKESAHDKEVRKIANKEKKNPNNVVRADVKGFDKPKPVGKDKRIPDVEVTNKKGGLKRLYEVETPKSVKTDKKQQTALKKSAAARGGTYIQKTIKKPPTKKPAPKKAVSKKTTAKKSPAKKRSSSKKRKSK